MNYKWKNIHSDRFLIDSALAKKRLYSESDGAYCIRKIGSCTGPREKHPQRRKRLTFCMSPKCEFLARLIAQLVRGRETRKELNIARRFCCSRPSTKAGACWKVDAPIRLFSEDFCPCLASGNQFFKNLVFSFYWSKSSICEQNMWSVVENICYLEEDPQGCRLKLSDAFIDHEMRRMCENCVWGIFVKWWWTVGISHSLSSTSSPQWRTIAAAT